MPEQFYKAKSYRTSAKHTAPTDSADDTDAASAGAAITTQAPPTGARLRGLAFAMLGRREHSGQELAQKLSLIHI